MKYQTICTVSEKGKQQDLIYFKMSSIIFKFARVKLSSRFTPFLWDKRTTANTGANVYLACPVHTLRMNILRGTATQSREITLISKYLPHFSIVLPKGNYFLCEKDPIFVRGQEVRKQLLVCNSHMQECKQKVTKDAFFVKTNSRKSKKKKVYQMYLLTWKWIDTFSTLHFQLLPRWINTLGTLFFQLFLRWKDALGTLYIRLFLRWINTLFISAISKVNRCTWYFIYSAASNSE